MELNNINKTSPFLIAWFLDFLIIFKTKKNLDLKISKENIFWQAAQF